MPTLGIMLAWWYQGKGDSSAGYQGCRGWGDAGGATAGMITVP